MSIVRYGFDGELYTFPERSHVELSLTPVYDDADRTVVARKLTVSIVATITPDMDRGPDQTTNAVIDWLLPLLENRGGTLIIEDTGFGSDWYINDPDFQDTLWDIQAGPKPRDIRWQILGSNLAGELTWHCDVMLPRCIPEGGEGRSGEGIEGIAALNYGCSWSISSRGFSQRTVHGYIQAVVKSIDPGQLGIYFSDTADAYRDSINVPVLANFSRTQQYDLSTDKTRLGFTITDTEIESPNAYPEGVISIRAPMRTRMAVPNARGTQAENSLVCHIELDQHTSRVRAWEIFQGLFFHRVRNIIDAKSAALVVTELTAEEDPYTNNYTFAIAFRAVLPFNLIMAQLGYFQPLEGGDDWGPWQGALVGGSKPHDNRGLAGLEHRQNDDSNDLYDPPISTCNQVQARVYDSPNITTPQPTSLPSLCNEPPPPESSYLKFDSYLIEYHETESYHHTTYGTPDIVEIDDDFAAEDNRKPGYQVAEGDYEESYSQAPPQRRFIWKGHAVRVGYPVPPLPRKQIGGRTAKVIGRPMDMARQIGTLFCQPLFERQWCIGLAIIEPSDNLENTDPTGLNDQEDDDTA